jgi:hypothetical protein
MNKLSFEEFVQKVMGGESRYYPGEAGGYVLIKEGGEEVFYSEWVYGDDVLDLNCEEVFKADEEGTINAYEAYIEEN